jgi:hypothetical protein
MVTYVILTLLADGVVEFRTAIPSKKAVQWTDPSYDMGTFAASE